ncbi:NAD-dependent epimerase/dehydratase family protein [Dactylosporangium sp. CA-092794]|uniref:NAD-dependent epimerase/dehydratase family protein n=1 Tax=Dactylosporangium sp. CA-092794 TaxID=3239929 RepID=UPI003D8FEDAE
MAEDGSRGPAAHGAPRGRALVLGGTGFVGRHVVAAFAGDGFEVTSVCRRPRGARAIAMDLAAGEPDALARVVDDLRPQVVVNAAGAVWEVDEAQMIAGNVTLARNVVAALSRTVHTPRLVHIGSVNEYTPQPFGRALAETTPTAPATQYGRTKLQGSEAVLAAAGAGRIDAVVLRLANLAGPGSPPSSLLGRVARRLRRADGGDAPAVVELTALRAHRDFVDALDAAAAVRAAAAARTGPALLNIGSGVATDIRALVDLLVRVSEVACRVVERPRPAAEGGRGPEWLRVDIGAARRLLGWAPARRLEDSLRDLWDEVRRLAPDVPAPRPARAPR